MALTDTALKALKPKQKAYVVSDDRSLYAEVLPTGAIVWRFRYRLNGKREKLTLGKYPALTLKNARLKRDEAAQLVAMGQSPAQKNSATRSPVQKTQLSPSSPSASSETSRSGIEETTRCAPVSGEGHRSPYRRQAHQGTDGRGRARRHLEEERTGVRRCRRPSARTSQTYAGLRDDMRLDQSQSGERASNAARLQSR